MDENADPKKLEHQIELAERAASILTDQTTAQRLRAFANDLRQMLQRAFGMSHRKQQVRTRAYELWEQAGKPPGRDQEFWLQAEREFETGDRDAR
jgi:DUF2934 family protein